MKVPERTWSSVGYRLAGGGVSTLMLDLREGAEAIGRDKYSGRTVLVRWNGLLWEESDG